MMKKEVYRDYAAEAFRFYASVGGLNRYTELLMADVAVPEGDGLKSRVLKPTKAVLKLRDKRLKAAASALADLKAVENVLAIFHERANGQEMIHAIQTVYMAQPDHYPGRGEIQDRVLRLAVSLPAAERTIYYWLQQARLTFAVERGLRCELQEQPQSACGVVG